MKPGNYNLRGWVGSILLHVAGALVLFLWQVGTTAGETEFVEVNLAGETAPEDQLPEAERPDEPVAGEALSSPDSGSHRTDVLVPARSSRMPQPTAAGRDAREVRPSARKERIASGSSVSYAIHWSTGASRRKLGGELPRPPGRINARTQIRIEAVVSPDGRVKSLRAASKRNSVLERAAINAVRRWRFESLRRSVRQRLQTCEITFNFRPQ